MREQSPKAMRKDLNETWRYDVDRGGAVGVGMGLEEDYDRVIIDDLEAKWVHCLWTVYVSLLII